MGVALLRLEFDRLSLEPSRRCSKACSFCYNGSSRSGDGEWSADDVITFGTDLAANGVRFLSLGGGEPLEWPGLFDALRGLEGVLRRSFTTNGLLLEARLDEVARARPDKVHVSLHTPESPGEVERVLHLATRLDEAGVASGINVLIRRSKLAEAREASRRLQDGGVGPERLIFLPWRGPGDETPTPREVAEVANGGTSTAFQSVACLEGCRKSARFVSVDASRRVAWCSYTTSRSRLRALTWRALVEGLASLGHRDCSGTLTRDLAG